MTMQDQDVVLETYSGEFIALQRVDMGFEVKAGRAELYLVTKDENGHPFQRQFILEAASGDMIWPQLEWNDGYELALVTPERSVLIPVLLDQPMADRLARKGNETAQRLERWIRAITQVMADGLETPRGRISQLNPDTKADCSPDEIFGSRSGISWIPQSETRSVRYWSEGDQDKGLMSGVMVLAPGLYVEDPVAQSISAISTLEALKYADWPDGLRIFQQVAFQAIARRALSVLRAADTQKIEQEESGKRLLTRVINTLHGVSNRRQARWKSVCSEEERRQQVFMIVADAIGLDLTQRDRLRLRAAATLEAAAQAAHLRLRGIRLEADWWTCDLGPLIGAYGPDRRAVALLPNGSGKWRMIDPVAGTDIAVTEALAGKVDRTAYVLYNTLPDKPISFGMFFRFSLASNRRDLALAAIGALAGAALSLATPLAMRLAFDRFIPGHNAAELIQLAIGLVMFACISTAFRVAYDGSALRIDGRAGATVAAAVLDRVLRLGPNQLPFGPADLALRIASADQTRRTLVNVVLAGLPAALLCIVNGAMLYYYAPFAAAVATTSLLVMSGIAVAFARMQRESQRRGEELKSDVFNIVLHLVEAIGVIRTRGAERHAFAHWGIDFAELRSRSHRARTLSSVQEALLNGLDLINWAGIFLLLAYMPTDQFSTGAFIAFVSAYGAFSGNAMQIVRSFGTLANLDTSWERALPLLKAVPEPRTIRHDPGRLTGTVELSNVAFRYNADAPPAVSGVSMQASEGEFVAIVGASGAGKSTLLRLLLGLEQPLQGTISFNGRDLRHLDPISVRRQIGSVLQNSRLLAGTIFENIAGNSDATWEQALEAARLAGIAADIDALPMGMHTLLTDGSALLSGGQVQRLLIARAIAARPRILLLDEATSALDNPTQAHITQSLRNLSITRIVVAHRLNTVKQADRIYMLDKGRVVQTGTFDQMSRTQGPFADFARRQMQL